MEFRPAIAIASLLCAACAHAAHTTSSTTTTTQAVQGSPTVTPPPTIAPVSQATVTATPSIRPIAANTVSPKEGALVFQADCSSCHQVSGQGAAGTFPPLAGNPVVVGDATNVIAIVKDGFAKAITVKGVSYNGEMPAWGQTLSVSDIAAVITYIRHAWGNSASAVTPAQVAATP